MKKTMLTSAAVLLLLVTCKRDEKDQENQAPVANAGKDISINRASCTSLTMVYLDGSRSSDPGRFNPQLAYVWTKISGLGNVLIKDSLTARPTASNLIVGQYVFELKVTDPLGLSDRDTVVVTVNGGQTEIDLDLNSTGTFSFTKKYEDCYYYFPCLYYDHLIYHGTGTHSALGALNFYLSENSDTAAASSAHSTYLNIYYGNVDMKYAYGETDLNFKKIIDQGGGGFNGSLQLKGGSAEQCGFVFGILPPLLIAGSIDTTTHKMSLHIKGKTFF